jgi:hypothetical protein
MACLSITGYLTFEVAEVAGTGKIAKRSGWTPMKEAAAPLGDVAGHKPLLPHTIQTLRVLKTLRVS